MEYYTEWITLGLLATGLFGMFLLYQWIVGKQDYPLETEIENALLPILHKLIIAAFEETYESLDTIEDRIANIDRNELALRIYDLLPETIGNYDVSFIQSILTQERFVALFEMVYTETKEYYVMHKGKFAKLFDEWK